MNERKTIFLLPTSRSYPRVDAEVSDLVIALKLRHFQQVGLEYKIWYYNGLSRPDYVNGDPYERLETLEGCGLHIQFGRNQGPTPCGQHNDTAGTAHITIGRSPGAFNTSSSLSLPANRQWLSLNIRGDDFKAAEPSGNNWDQNPDAQLPLFLENGQHYAVTSEVLNAFADWLHYNAFRHVEGLEIPIYRETEVTKESMIARAEAELQNLITPPSLFPAPILSEEDQRRIAAGWTRHGGGSWSVPAPAQSREDAVPFEGFESQA